MSVSYLLFYDMEKELIFKSIEPAVAGRGCFIVDVEVSKDNDIDVTITRDDAGVTIDDCVALSRHIESKLDRDKEDYSLMVGSAGIDYEEDNK